MENPYKDILGKAISDYLSGESHSPLLVHSDVAETSEMSLPYLFRKEHQLPEIEKIALNHCRGKILDIGAGAGSHSLILQEKNADVTAIDISPLAVQAMKKRGIKKVRNQNAFALSGEKFDTLLMLMNGIGIVETTSGLEKFFAHAKKLLRKGGQILADSSDIIYLFIEDDGSVLINLNDKYYGEVIFQFEYKGEKSEPFGWLYIAPDTLSSYAEKYDFQTEILAQGKKNNFLMKIFLPH